MSLKSPLPKSFHYAFEGIMQTLKEEPNFRVHIAIASLALITGFVLNLEVHEWLILLLTISFVLILELVNTAIEALVDLASPKIHPKAKLAKDVGAAAVLFAALVAIVVGVLLFLPKVILLIK